MPNNKDNQKSGSQSSMSGDSNQEFESQREDKRSGMEGQSERMAGSTSNRGTGGDSDMEDDMMNSAGGREGNFSDKNRGSEAQWSPGGGSSSDQ